jgi:hypothetical protein
MSDVLSTLHSAYSFIRGIESNQAINALTLDHLIQAQIDLLKKGSARKIVDSQGRDDGTRVSRWDQIDALATSMQKVIDSISEAGTDTQALANLGLVDIAPVGGGGESGGGGAQRTT